MTRNSASKSRFAYVPVAVIVILVVGTIACWKKKEFEVPPVGAGNETATAGPRSAGLAEGKPWQASSGYETFPQAGTMMASPTLDYFCHTKEEDNPWVEVDLGSVQSIRSVTVVNRIDCCRERANPLVVEVGTDRGSLKEVARRTSVFDTWTAKFPPQEARYVRVRVDGRAFLHLSLIGVD